MDIMKNILKYAAVAAIASLSIISCRVNRESKMEMDPKEVVETFSRAIASGDFEKASSLCDTVSMRTYLENWISIRKEMEEKDSSILAIASSILSEAGITIESSEKTETGRAVYYRIEAEGKSKRKMAALKKEEGEWRVEAITDVI